VPTKGRPASIRRPIARVGDEGLVGIRREQIVQAATKLVTRQGFAKTVIREIAEEADMSVGLVYEYIRKKEDILFLIMEHGSDMWRKGLTVALEGGDAPLVRLRRGVSFLVDAANRYPDHVLVWYRESGNLSSDGLAMVKRAEQDLVDRLQGVIKEAIDNETLLADCDPLFVATMLVISSHTWVLKGYLLHHHISPEAFASDLVAGFVAGFATAKGRRLLQAS
jgi:AcrR family transcriptional regulator